MAYSPIMGLIKDKKNKSHFFFFCLFFYYGLSFPPFFTRPFSVVYVIRSTSCFHLLPEGSFSFLYCILYTLFYYAFCMFLFCFAHRLTLRRPLQQFRLPSSSARLFAGDVHASVAEYEARQAEKRREASTISPEKEALGYEPGLYCLIF